MRRAVVGIVALTGALLATPSVESAGKPKPRFTVAIEGTQRFEWSLDWTRYSDGSPAPCGFKGSGRQVVSFRTARPVKVLVPPGTGLTYTYGGQPFLPVATRKRLVPIVGEERHEYRALQPPNLSACSAYERTLYASHARDCAVTNPFLPGAGVVVMRSRPRGRPHTAMMYSPVDMTLFRRRSPGCDVALFDLRNYLITQLVTIKYLPLRGGNFERRTTKVVMAAGHVHYCIDPSRSDLTEARFRECDRPARPTSGPTLTGTITADWKLTFRRAR